MTDPGSGLSAPMAAGEEPVFPCSFAQERLWVIDRLYPGNTLYNIFVVVRLIGVLDKTALLGSFRETVWRHESLRTVFREVDGVPVQVIRSSAEMEFETLSRPAGSEEEKERQIGLTTRHEAARPFDLRKDPMLRVRVLEFSERDHALILTMHHIAGDGWSMGIMVREFSALYAAFTRGEKSPLAELPVQYADYAVWQREWLKGEVLERQLQYWRNKLSGASVPELPADFPGRTRTGLHSEIVPFHFPANLTGQIRTLARRETATVFMLLLAALDLVLARYAGQNDVLVGTAVANRGRTELEGLVGLFVNTLVLRTDLSGNPGLKELIGRVRMTTLEAYTHQDLPFEKLVAELHPEREPGRTPLFQVMMVLQNTEKPVLELPGLRVADVKAGEGGGKFELSLDVEEDARGGLGGKLEYATELFEREKIQRLLGHWQLVLKKMAEDLSQSIDDISLLTDAEWKQVVLSWNRTDRDYSHSLTFPEMFDAQVEMAAERVAVEYDGHHLTYGALDRISGRIADFLIGKRVMPEVRVGVCLDRGPELIAGLVGILKAGGAFVPLDPMHPVARLRQMIHEAGIRVVVAHPGFSAQLPEFDGDVFVPDANRLLIRREVTDAPAVTLHPGNLAYVIFTSGSTGVPRAVGVEHSALNNQLAWARETLELTSTDRVLQKTSVSFDASLMETLLPLASGAQIVIAKSGGEYDVDYLMRLLAEESITYVDLSPVHLENIVRHPAVHELKSLRLIVCGGDALSPAAARESSRSLPAKLYNMYGPTETTVQSTFALCTGESDPLIGRPIANTRVYVLSPEFQPAPIGVPGELYIGGGGLARGYLDRPDYTAERFVPDPFSRTGGERLYRSGDRVRWRTEGELEFLGRLDQQVKVRGIRIELGEIESILTRHPDVKQAAVVLREIGKTGKQLIAYLVSGGTQCPERGALRKYLKEYLPESMMPSRYVFLTEPPLTVGGKIARNLLPEPEESIEERPGPNTPEEETITRIFAELLKLKEVDADRSFFALGGHSLLAARVISRVRHVFGTELPLGVLFEHPTARALAARIAEIQKPAAATIPPILPVERNRPLPLSYAQQRLWLIDQMEPGNSVYNMTLGLRLSGKLNAAALRWSLNEIARRHEVLRSRFPEHDGNAVLEISGHVSLAIEERDLISLSGEDREREARNSLRDESARPFDLAQGPLLRARLLRLSHDEHVLIVAMHHIVSDGWSFGVMVKEFNALYRAAVAGEATPLQPLSIQYADYAVWQRQWLRGEVLSEQIAYWKKQLAGTQVLNLPADATRPAVMSHRGDSTGFRFHSSMVEMLRGQGERRGVTLFMSLLAGFAIVLAKYSGQSDVVVGTPIAGRNRIETEDLIGFFVNTLALRVGLNGENSVRELLRNIRETALAAYRHQDLPFEKLVEELQPERDLSRTPVFQTMLILQNVEDIELCLPELRITEMRMPAGRSKFDLTITLSPCPDGGLTGEAEFLADVFSRERMARLADHLEIVLEQIAREPEKNLRDLEMLSASERSQMLVEWNRTEANYPSRASAVELLREQAEKIPDAIAVDFEGSQLTYGELNGQACQMARYLRRYGAGGDVRIGICMDRSLEMVIAMIAIWKAGSAYVPLDPAHPTERLRYMLLNSGAEMVVTRGPVAEVLLNEFRVLDVMKLRTEIIKEDRRNPEARVTEDNLAYVIFTSGSTGLPNGVEVPHSALTNQLFAINSELSMRGEDRVLAIATLSFDISLLELYLPLAAGARVVLLSRETAMEGTGLLDAVSQGITVMQATPASWRLLLQAGWKGTEGLRAWCGGEALAPELAELLLERSAGLWNLYGPTETTVWVLISQLSKGEPVSIGRPVANTYLYVLDGEMRPLPCGVFGELYIGGAGVARGYSGRPDLTAERFLPDAFSGRSGARLYRTGDMVRYRFDGKLEYHGRNDHQIKLRGHRIEPGEIEAALLKMPEIAQAKVLVREERPGDQRLVAYVVPSGEDVTSDELRPFLAGKLPDYMVPGSYVFLEELPLTANGKVDRRALLLTAPEEQAQESSRPRTLTEEIVAGIWSSVLGVDKVGLHDNFFHRGGYSLLATQVVSRIRNAFHLEVPVRAIFETPTVSGLAQRIGQLRETAVAKGPAIEQVADRREAPLSFSQERLWFLDQLDPGSPAYNMLFGLRLRGDLDRKALMRSLKEIVARHDILRTTFHLRGDAPIQVVRGEMEIPADFVDLRALEAGSRREEMERLRTLEAEHSFDLARGPLVRFQLIVFDEEDHVLLANMHHIVSDAWSMGIVVRELSSLYGAYTSGAESPLLPLTIQYADYAIWQREWLKGELPRKELEYWREHLAGAAALELPADYLHQGGLITAGDRISFEVSGELLRRIKEFSGEHGITAFMVLLAAFDIVLSRYTGRKDILIGTESANRGRMEIEGLIGFYANQLALRADLRGEQTVLEFLQQVRAVSLAAYENQNVPFERVVEELQPRRSGAPSPLFRVKFVFENVPREEFRLAKIDTELLPEAFRLARMDLTLYFWDLGDCLSAALEYSVELFRRSTVEGISRHFIEVLTAMLAAPFGSIDSLTFGSDGEQDELTSAFLANN